MRVRIGCLSALALSVSLPGCAVGPEYRRPDAAVPDHFARALRVGTAAHVPGDPAGADPSFWSGFGDPVLGQLVAQALAANQDLHLALSRHDAAAAFASEAGFDRYPTLTASAQVGHQLLSRDEAFGAPRDLRNTPLSGADVNASWELDLFGRVRRGIEAQRAEIAASSADLRAVRVAIEAEVAGAYVELRGTQARLRIAHDNADNQQQTLAWVEARIAAGRGSDLDAARARAQLESTTSRIAVHEATIGTDEHRLAVLSGQSPDALIAQLDAPAPLPAFPVSIDAGAPGDLLRRRPDVAAAEARLHAATARVGVATADLFPRFTLTGLVGSLTDSYGVAGTGSGTNLAVLGIDWSFLDVGRVRARIAASDADAAGQLAQYQQTVLLALEETENALLHVARTQEELAHLERASADSTRAAELARERYTDGAIDYYQVLDAERTRLKAQDAAADALMRRDMAAVALYRALAGGWLHGGTAPVKHL
jgi:NodT family efflux transporter outer membrane factor (OMF) lipoprotein